MDARKRLVEGREAMLALAGALARTEPRSPRRLSDLRLDALAGALR